jgi:hypothetical protein
MPNSLFVCAVVKILGIVCDFDNIFVPLQKKFKNKEGMMTIKNVNPAQAYLEGMLWAAYGVQVISGSVAEWQIDKVKESALKLKEAEIDHSSLSLTEKENQKRQWKQSLEAYIHGVKDQLKREGKLI